MDAVTDLDHHGDAELAPGLIDLAVNVRAGMPPPWLRAVLHDALDAGAAYPDAGPARAAVAAAHGRPAGEVLLTAGAAEAFTLVARALTPRRAVVVHPSFTEPEAALRAAGHPVERLLLEPPGYLLREVPDDADLVVLGNPTNPTSVLHPHGHVAALARPGRVLLVDEAFADTVPGETESLAGRRDLPGLLVVRSLTKTWGLAGLRVGYALGPPELVAALARPGRVLVVDEAFADTVPGEPESLAGRADLPGLLVVRSLTKTWGLAGLRVGYALGPADLVAALAAQQPHWPVSTPALAALRACTGPAARAEAVDAARRLEEHRRVLLGALPAGVEVVGTPRSSFVLLRVPHGAQVREQLRDQGWAVRRGDTFPGLTGDHLRVAVRDPRTSRAFVSALAETLDRIDTTEELR